MEEDMKRIAAILGGDTRRSAQNAGRYRAHLLRNLSLPIRVTGIMDFPWEEPYIYGGWDEQEYEELKKTNPSFSDIFELQDIKEPAENDYLVAKLKRISDSREFEVGLSFLCSIEEEGGKAHTLLNDYSFWYANY